MSDIKDGGPAFAHQLESNRDGYAITGGMTLRDYFAAKAMQAAMMNITDWKYAPSQIATYSYAQADAMIKARSAK